jgi:low affinity Fe/Cu permease
VPEPTTAGAERARGAGIETGVPRTTRPVPRRSPQGPRPAGAFARFARRISIAVGRPWAFAVALGVVLVWAVTGPLFHFSDTWQLVINTGTTIVTFLMVFVIQSTQNRDSEAMHVKLDELIRAVKGAHLALLDLEELSDRDLEKIRADYAALAGEARRLMRRGEPDTGTPGVRSSRGA